MNLKLKDALTQRQRKQIIDDSRRPSAVLVPVYCREGRYFILFTLRTELVHYHKGEISFPGGGYSPIDGTLLATALRESYEEIGLLPEDVEILGEMDDALTRGSNYIITPFLGFISPDYSFKTSRFEIAEIIQAPVDALLEEGCRTQNPVEVLSGRRLIPYVYTYQDKKIIGATARILKQFLDIYSQVTRQG
ncbi:MAG: CoA pyrophosphatase [Dehalococcoidales bacterium]|nr:CoA pyrophosphatase [Dehalococcoidales bacterium]